MIVNENELILNNPAELHELVQQLREFLNAHPNTEESNIVLEILEKLHQYVPTDWWDYKTH